MKKIIFLQLFILTILITNAQKPEWLFGLNKDSAKMFAINIMGNYKSKFMIDTCYEVEKPFNTKYFYTVFKNSDVKDNENKPTYFTLIFQRFNIGENKNLELEGVPRYYLHDFQGKYLELFSIWQTYIEPLADKVKLSTSIQHLVDVDNPLQKKEYAHCILQQVNDGDWEIRIIDHLLSH